MAYKTGELRGTSSLYFDFSSRSHFQQYLNGGCCPGPWLLCSYYSSSYATVGQRAVGTALSGQPSKLKVHFLTCQYWILQQYFQISQQQLFKHLPRG